MSERVLVTGGAGFLGNSLVRRLVAEGYRVSVLDRVPLRDALVARDVDFALGDVRDPGGVARAAQGVDAIIHCVAVQPVSRSRRSLFTDVNARGTENVLEAALRGGARRVVHLSSSAPYGIPRSVPITEVTPFAPICEYGRSKVLAERACGAARRRGLDVVILRPRVVIGPGRLGVYQMLFNWVADGKPIYTLGAAHRPFQALAVDDLAEACLLALSSQRPGEDYNLGTDRFGSFRSDLEALTRHAGTGARTVSLPAAPVKAVLSVLDALDLSPLTAWHYRTVDVEFHFDCGKARDLLGWTPKIGNVEMLRAAYDWYVAHRRAVDRDLGRTHTQSLPQRALRVIKALS